MNRERLENLGRYGVILWAGIAIFGGIIYTNRNWDAESVEIYGPEADFVLGSPGRATSVYVEQGPVWLAKFLFNPPWWLAPSLYAVVAIVVGVAAYKVHQRGVDPEVLEEVANRAVELSAVAGGVLLLKATGQLPYLVDVLGGLVIGLVIGQVARRRMDWGRILDVEEGTADA